jgi:hypothetical protein
MSFTKNNMENNTIKSFAKNIKNYSKTLTLKEQEILCYLILSTMDPITRTKWVLSRRKNFIFSLQEMELLDKLIDKDTKNYKN